MKSELHRISRLRVLAFVASVGVLSAAGGAARAESSLSGSWSGGGAFTLSSGATEKARCRASYTKSGGKRFLMSATCATSSASVNQAATLVQTGANRYAGSFYNAEYGTGGSISVTVSGSSQSIRLSGAAGSGRFSLKKR